MEDAAESDRRRGLSDGWLHEWDVSLLIELGHLEEVTRRADRGDWFCAHGLATKRQLDGHHDVALEVLWPFAQTGWWIAIKAVATIMADCGRTDEAVTLCRPAVASGDRDAIEYSARLLAHGGRAGEAFDLLRPSVDDWFHARALVEVSVELGREGEVTQLLLEAIERPRWPGAGADEIVLHLELLATVLERQGRVDEAVALLNQNLFSSNIIEHLAATLIRHQRYDELRELLAGRPDASEICQVVEQLPEGIDLDRVASAIRAIPDPEACHAAYHPDAVLGRMLIRAGRTIEGSPSCERLWILRISLPCGSFGYCSSTTGVRSKHWR
ncbi:tetratricopeptide repeat protein [Nocardia fluminea]|uniref:tetratricopeptide repeat protein n=1 Tax=Nocardia fluminea TaxID=134984 RepID=UPI00382CCD82